MFHGRAESESTGGYVFIEVDMPVPFVTLPDSSPIKWKRFPIPFVIDVLFAKALPLCSPLIKESFLHPPHQARSLVLTAAAAAGDGPTGVRHRKELLRAIPDFDRLVAEFKARWLRTTRTCEWMGVFLSLGYIGWCCFFLLQFALACGVPDPANQSRGAQNMADFAVSASVNIGSSLVLQPLVWTVILASILRISSRSVAFDLYISLFPDCVNFYTRAGLLDNPPAAGLSNLKTVVGKPGPSDSAQKRAAAVPVSRS